MGIEITAKCDVCKKPIKYIHGFNNHWNGNEFQITFCFRNKPDGYDEAWNSSDKFSICESCGKKIEKNLFEFLHKIENHEGGGLRNF